MSRNQKILMTVLWALLVLSMISVIGAGLWANRDRTGGNDHGSDVAKVESQPQPAGVGLPVLYPSPAFALIDQNGNPMTERDLAGNVWIADFVFTHCGGPCPMMTAHLAKLSKQIEHPGVKFVSFTVDPQRDTPEVLREYAGRYDADHARWHLLTGQKKDLYDVAAGMKITAKPATDDAPIIHSEKFVLIDGSGQIRGYYDGNDAEALKRVAADAMALARAGAKP
ncbi:MAG: SCO family protein [Tepidisphaeraceae bacterium]